jgi:hypothetical protein
MEVASLPKGLWISPGSARFLALLLVIGVLFSFAWTQLGYRYGNLEAQGIDIAHHAIIIRQLTVPGGINERSLSILADYPTTSHRLAALTLPLFGDNEILALRFSAMTTVTWLLALQFTLLCRWLPFAQAALVLLAWQWLCYLGKVTNSHHFLEWNYNFSRAVGGLGLWAGLVLLAAAESSSAWGRRLNYALATGGAAFAMACHVVPGAVAFGGLILYGAGGWLRTRQPDRLWLIAMAILTAGGMYFGTSVWRVMVQNAGSNGGLPVGPQLLLLTWVPLAAVAAFLLVRPILARFASGIVTAPIPTECLMTALLAAGAVQSMVLVRMVLWHACAPYAFKTLYFYTFPLAALLGIVGLVPYLARVSASWLPLSPGAMRRMPQVVAASLLLAGVLQLAHKDLGLRRGVSKSAPASDCPPPERLPAAVARTLDGLASDHQGWCYFDPQQPVGAFFASVVGLHLEWETAVFCREKLVAGDYEAVLSHPRVHGILLAATSLPPDVLGKKVGPFQEIPAPLNQGK